MAITQTERNKEDQRLLHTLAVIDRQIAVLEGENLGGRDELREFRGYIAENRRQMDGAEKASLRQMASVLDTKVHSMDLSLQRLRKLAVSPYFGRLDFQRTETPDIRAMYVGMSTLLDDSDILVYDWRAPIAAMYYDAEVGPAAYVAPSGRVQGDILLKRQYKIEQRELRYLFDSNVVINDDMLQEALAQNTSEKMRHIVTSIQKEQNSVIRDETTRYLIVHGPAGSGKTSIAMHRAAYLLYRYRESMSAEQMMIFSPNGIFADYISSVLPELGEENIYQVTFDAYAAALLGRKVRPESRYAQMEYLLLGNTDATFQTRTTSIRFKASPLFHQLITRYAEHLEDTLWHFTEIRVGGTQVMSAAEVQRVFKERCAHLPLLQGLALLKELVLLMRPGLQRPQRLLVSKQLDTMLTERDAGKLYRRLFDGSVLLRALAGDAEVPEALEEICALTAASLKSGTVWYEDVAPLLLLKLLIDGTEADTGIRHVLIDEAQDYTPLHFAILRQRFPDSSMTILGDLDQAVNPCLYLRSYQDLAQVFGRETSTLIRLTKSYRSSKEIAALARAVLPNAGKTDDVRTQGELPQLIDVADEAAMVAAIAAQLPRLREDGYASVAVICKTAQQARALHKALAHHQADLHLIDCDAQHFHHGCVILPIYLAKGLEFDAVILADVSAERYSLESDRRLLYTACTRALHQLSLYYTGIASPLLPLADAGYYRPNQSPS